MLRLKVAYSTLANCIQIRLRLRCLAILDIAHKPRNGDGRQNTDDGDDDHEFDEGKAFARRMWGGAGGGKMGVTIFDY